MSLYTRYFWTLVIGGFVLINYQNCAKVKFSSDQASIQNIESCDFNGQSLLIGESTIAWNYDISPAGQICVSEQRTCTAKDQLTGSYAYSTCVNGGACTPNQSIQCVVPYGRGEKVCDAAGSYPSTCQALVCNAGYRLVNGSCIVDTCTSTNDVACSSTTTNFTMTNAGTGQCSGGNGTNSCVSLTCLAPGQMQSANPLVCSQACSGTSRSCRDGNGIGTQACQNGVTVGECLLTSCEPGFTFDTNLKVCVTNSCSNSDPAQVCWTQWDSSSSRRCINNQWAVICEPNNCPVGFTRVLEIGGSFYTCEPTLCAAGQVRQADGTCSGSTAPTCAYTLADGTAATATLNQTITGVTLLSVGPAGCPTTCPAARSFTCTNTGWKENNTGLVVSLPSPFYVGQSCTNNCNTASSCNYNFTGAQYAVPTNKNPDGTVQIGGTVTGFSTQTAVHPALCSSATATCSNQGAGPAWTGSGVPKFVNCIGQCAYNGTNYNAGATLTGNSTNFVTAPASCPATRTFTCSATLGWTENSNAVTIPPDFVSGQTCQQRCTYNGINYSINQEISGNTQSAGNPDCPENRTYRCTTNGWRKTLPIPEAVENPTAGFTVGQSCSPVGLSCDYNFTRPPAATPQNLNTSTNTVPANAAAPFNTVTGFTRQQANASAGESCGSQVSRSCQRVGTTAGWQGGTVPLYTTCQAYCTYNGNGFLVGAIMSGASPATAMYPTQCQNQTYTCTNAGWSPSVPNAFVNGQTCTQTYTYSWQRTGTGACNATCGSGQRSVTYSCYRNDGQIVANNMCGTMPSTYESCPNLPSCGCPNASDVVTSNNSANQNPNWYYDVYCSCSGTKPVPPWVAQGQDSMSRNCWHYLAGCGAGYHIETASNGVRSCVVDQVCTPGTSTSSGCPSIANGTSTRTCDGSGSGYGSCTSTCNSGFNASGSQPNITCTQAPTCPNTVTINWAGNNSGSLIDSNAPGILPNGHPWCYYEVWHDGDKFCASVDKTNGAKYKEGKCCGGWNTDKYMAAKYGTDCQGFYACGSNACNYGFQFSGSNPVADGNGGVLYYQNFTCSSNIDTFQCLGSDPTPPDNGSGG